MLSPPDELDRLTPPNASERRIALIAGVLFVITFATSIPVLSRFVRQRLGTFIAKPNSADLDALRALIEARSVTPAVDRVVALDQVPDAIRDRAAGRVSGKIVIVT